MNLKDTLQHIHSDYRRYRATGESGLLQVILFKQGFWASFVYRMSHWVYTDVKIPVLRQLLRSIFTVARKWVEILTGVSLPAKCQVGKGLYIGHFGHIIIHPDVKIGDNCNLSQGITLGLMSRGKRKGVPQIGNRVFIGPNSIIIGNITIGDDAAIGAGAIVTQSVPPMAVVAGNSAQIISYHGSFELINSDDIE